MRLDFSTAAFDRVPGIDCLQADLWSNACPLRPLPNITIYLRTLRESTPALHVSKIDGGQHIARSRVEGFANGEKALETREMRAALNRADLGDAEPRHASKIL